MTGLMAERKKLLLRPEPSVYDAIAKWAADDLRSVNPQTEYALRSDERESDERERNGPAEPGGPGQ
jgi:hypothetical protein